MENILDNWKSVIVDRYYNFLFGIGEIFGKKSISYGDFHNKVLKHFPELLPKDDMMNDRNFDFGDVTNVLTESTINHISNITGYKQGCPMNIEEEFYRLWKFLWENRINYSFWCL